MNEDEIVNGWFQRVLQASALLDDAPQKLEKNTSDCFGCNGFCPGAECSFFRFQLQLLHQVVLYAHPAVCLYDSGSTGGEGQRSLQAGRPALNCLYGLLPCVLLSAGGG